MCETKTLYSSWLHNPNDKVDNSSNRRMRADYTGKAWDIFYESYTQGVITEAYPAKTEVAVVEMLRFESKTEAYRETCKMYSLPITEVSSFLIEQMKEVPEPRISSSRQKKICPPEETPQPAELHVLDFFKEQTSIADQLGYVASFMNYHPRRF